MVTFERIYAVLNSTNISQESIEESGTQILQARTEEEIKAASQALSLFLKESLVKQSADFGQKVLSIFFILNEVLNKSPINCLSNFQKYMNEGLRNCLQEIEDSCLSATHIGHMLKVLGIWKDRNLLNKALLENIWAILNSKLVLSEKGMTTKPNFEYADLVELADANTHLNNWKKTKAKLQTELEQMDLLNEESVEKELKKSNLTKCDEKIQEHKKRAQKASGEALQINYFLLMKSLLDLKAIDDKIESLEKITGK
jgi:hypothetical protein